MGTQPALLRALRIASAAALVSALSSSSIARADGPAPVAQATPPGQKPPCVPATNYLLGYDCELFPLPTLPAAAAVPAAAGAVNAAAAAPEPAAVPPAAAPAAPSAAVAVPAAPVAVAAVPAAPVVVAAVVVPPADAPVTSSSSPSHAPAYVAFALGAGGVGVAVAFGVLSLSANSTLSQACSNGTCPSSQASTLSSLKLDENMADIGVGVAAAGLITGIILFVTEKPSTSSAMRHVEPWVGLGSGGVRGTF